MRKAYVNLIQNGIAISTIVYFSIVSLIGLSIVSYQNGLVTYWSNNYGDFPFHLGITANFAFNMEILKDYQVYPGVPLSYYFFIDFWTACFSFEPDNWKLFCLIYFFQWISSWAIIYFTFNFFKSGFNSYLLLFGGGTFTIFFKQLIALIEGQDVFSQLSHNYLRDGYPWTVFISCIWIPQRGAVLGLAILVVCLSLWSSLKSREKIESAYYEILIAIVLSLTFMVHFYLALVGISIISLSLLQRFIFCRTRDRDFHHVVKYFTLALLFTLPSFYLLHTKHGIMKVVGFWMPWKSDSMFNSEILGALEMWAINAVVLFIFFTLVFRKKIYSETIPLIMIFLLFNIFQFSVWDWDTYKAFIGIYCAVICFYTVNNHKSFWGYLLIILAILPGVMETAVSLSIKKPYEIYSKVNLNQARLLRERTGGGAIVAKASHNSIVTAAGRQIFLGYEGWLSSHAIDYVDRAASNKELLNSFTCEKFLSLKEKPEYIYFDVAHAKRGQDALLTSDAILPNLKNLNSSCR